MKSNNPPPLSTRLGYTIRDALETGAFPTRNKLYNAINRGDIATWRDGRSRMISAESLQRYIERKIREAA